MAMIPLDVDRLLAQIREKSLCAGVTRVTEVTPSVIPSPHAGQEPLTAVTQADPPTGNTGNTLVVGTPDGETVTPVTQRPLALGNRGVVPQGIDTVRVSKTATAVTLVTQKKSTSHTHGRHQQSSGAVRCATAHGVGARSMVC